MPGNTGTIKIALQIDDKGSVKILRDIGSESQKTGKTGKESFDKMDKGARDFSTGAGKASSALLKIAGGVAGIMAVKIGLEKLVGMTKEYVNLAGIQEAAEAKLSAVLKATGNAAGYNLDQLKAMAGGLQQVTTIGDETTLAGMSILATFKEIKGKAFEGATKAAMDMSAVMGQDLKSSMVQVGKALNDPIQGLTALSRVGVSFTDEQKEMIQTLQESGDVMGAQKVILAELNSEFGGAAEALSKTFSGSVDQANNAMGDMKEELGFIITKNQFFIELTHLATAEFVSWGEKIKNNREYLMQLGKDGVMTVVKGLGYALETMEFFHTGWLGIRLVANLALEGIGWLLEQDIKMMRAFLKPLDMIFDGLVKMGTIKANPFDSMTKGIEDFRWASASVTKEIQADLDTTKKVYGTIKGAIQGWQDKIAAVPVTQAAASEKITRAVVNGNVATEKSTQKTAKSIEDIWDKTFSKTEKASVDYGNQYIKDREKEKKETQRTAAAILTATDKMYKDLGISGQKNYYLQEKLLNNQAKDYETLGVDAVTIERWKTGELKKLTDQQTLDSNDFFAGVRIGLQRNQEEFQTWAQRGLDITQTVTNGMHRAFSDTLFSALKGDIDDISQVWDGFMDSMLHKLTDTVADMAIKWGIGAIGGITGWWDTGAWEVKKDHVAVVHAGEMIVPADVAQLLRNGAQNPREGMGGPQISDLAQVSPSGGYEWSVEDKALLTSFTKGTLGTYAPYAGQGISLFAKGAIDSNTLMSGLFNPDNLIQSAFFGGVPTTANEMLGMRTSAWGTSGQTALSQVGGTFLGPVGALLGGLMGGTAGMALGDFFNARSFEIMRDYLETELGWLQGQQAFDALSKRVNAAHGGTAGVFDLNDPTGYEADYGFGDFTGPDFGDAGDGETGAMGGYDGGDYAGDFSGYAAGGIVNRVMVPGEDGWAAVQLGEGVVSKRGIETLDKINAGDAGGGSDRLEAAIYVLIKELRAANIKIIPAVQKTASYTELSFRKAVQA